jgi:hypothetical protein
MYAVLGCIRSRKLRLVVALAPYTKCDVKRLYIAFGVMRLKKHLW